ncbi:MAG: 2-oxo acid dehydrogenase subunit E2 [Gemmatimonadetes bacterium]|nr:2-oxo acid dehydrogenase subunit E2 [Gemmatimonadota bacterium]NNK49567.1 2-oxo acid dehydrogenase subunit E2 [Gemmatimonadota bacterium]
MSKVDVIMPQMGESIAEGTLTRWIKQIGETVERDEDLFEISTDKVDADIPSPVAGTLVEILVEEGATVEVNTVVARIDTEGGAAEPSEPQADAAPVEESAPEVAPVAAAAESPAPPAQPATPVAPAASSEGTETREERIQGKSTPLVRKIAAEHDVDLADVTGSGIAGRVTRDDILAHIDTRATAPVTAADAPALPSGSAPAIAPAAPAAAGQPGMMQVPIHGATLDIRIPSVPIREGDTVEEMSRVRLRTMEHMLMSRRVSAHVTSVNEIDFEHIVRLRKKLKPKFAEQGVKLTYGPFIMKAVIEALREYPIVNASVDGTRIVYHRDINLGIAVAVADGKELIVPVLKNADQLSLMGLTTGANDLAEKARTKTLDFDDIQGGSFTITNVGVFGNQFGMPIINQPQVAILGTGVIEKRPVVVQDTMGNDVVGIRHMSYFGLSYDHRVVDGAIAAFWLNKVKDVLENFPEDVM